LFYIWQESTNSGSTWSAVSSNGNGEDYVVPNLTTSTWFKRLTVDLSSTCANQETGVVKFTVTPTTNIGTQPSSEEACAADNVTFSIAATGSGLNYQWQEDDGGGFSNITNGGIYSGATTNSLTLTNVTTAENGYDYRCVVSSTACPDETSNEVSLTVLAAPVVTVAPSDVVECQGENVSFSVTTTGDNVTYQWQEDDGGGFSNIANGGSYSGVTTATLSISSITTGLDGYDYRCVADNTACPSTNSASADLDVVASPSVTADPSNATICEDANTSFTVTATGDNLTYQWQEDDGGGFANITNGGVYSGATTATLNLTSVPNSMHGYKYQVIVDNANCNSTTSASALLTIQFKPNVTSDPSSQTVCVDDDPSFGVVATGTSLSYQWQEDDGGGFTNLSNGGKYTGATSANLSISDVTSGMDGYDYRCVVSGTCTPSDNSATATLTVQSKPTVTVDPSDDTQCAGDNSSFSVTATGTAITYQWQERKGGGGYADLSNGGIYSNVTTATLSLTGVTASMDGYSYRCVVDNSSCNSTTSGVGFLSVETAPNVTSDPSNQTVCVDDDPTFTVVSSGDGLTYQWQEDDGGGFANIANGGVYSGATTATLTLTNVTLAMSTYEYKCIVSGNCTPNDESNAAVLTVQPSPSITSQPSAQTVCVDDDPTFSVTATGTGVTYQWQEDDGGGFSNISNGGVYSGATTATLSITDATASMDAYEYRCVVSGTCNPSVTSNEVALTVHTAPSFSPGPASTTYCTGEDVVFSPTINGSALSYQWQEDDGGGFANLSNNATYSGVTTASLTISSAPIGFDGYKYQVVATNTGCGSVTSGSATITATAAPAVTSNPSNQTVCVDGDPTFSITATGASLSFQWQEDDGGGFSNISNDATYSGATTSSLTITDAAASMNGYDYRCVVTSTSCPTATSSSASLTVNSPPAITTDPSDLTACDGDNISFTVVATGTALTYQWQEDQGSGFSNLSNGGKYSNVTTATLGISAITTAFLGYKYRCVVSGTCPSAQTSASATLTVTNTVTISAQPAGTTVCALDDPTFSVTASGGTITYQWQEDDGGGYANLANGGIYSGVTTSTLTLTNVGTGIDGYDYRCVVSSTCGGTINSNGAKLNVDSDPVVTTDPSNTTKCESTGASFGVVATGSNLTYQWQEDDGSGFANITNGGIYSGATSTSLSISAVTNGMNGYDYRCVVSNTGCGSTNSNSAQLTVEAAPDITATGGDQTECETDNATFTVTATGAALTYQWQEDDGGGFSNISNGGDYSGATSASLTVANVSASEDGYKYQCVVSGTCTPSATSTSNTLSVLKAPAVTTQPSATTVCENANTSFTVVASGDALTYQWQEDDGGGFVNLANGGSYSGVTTATLSITSAATTIDGYDYRCVVSNTACASANSSSAKITVQVAPAVTTAPSDATICESTNASFTVVATGTSLTYQWQEDDGGGFSNITNGGIYSNATTATLSLTSASTAVDGYKYRCVVDNAGCTAANSSSATLTVQESPSVSVDPSDQTVCETTAASFKVTASGSSISYQWQEDDGGGFANLANGGIYSGVTTATLSLSAASAAIDGYKYRCVISNSQCSDAQSASATLTVQTNPSISSSPSDAAICEAGNTSFSVTASGTAIAYQWQEDQGSGFSNISNGGVYSGATTATLSITSATTGMNGYDYRCVVDNSTCNAVNSVIATLTVNTSPSVTVDPKDSSICETNGASFSVTATGSALTYQWQEDDGGGYANVTDGGIYSGATTATLSITSATSGMNTYTYRCIVDNSTCSQDVSSDATLTVQTNPIVTGQPSAATICENTGTSFTVTATGSSITYQWQEDQGSGFSNISNGGVYSGATTATLSISNASASFDGYKYRCVVDNATCVATSSNSATLTVQENVAITVAPSASSICESDNTSFSVTATGSSLTYQWQEDDGGGFSNISNGGVYSGATTATLSITSATSGMDGYDYRCVVDNSACSDVTSTSATLTVQISPTVTSDPSNVTICESTGASFSVIATGTALTYQWQEDDGSGFANVSNGGVYSGATTATLTISTASAAMDGYKYRCSVDNANCNADVSADATLTVQSNPLVTTGPSDETVCENTSAGFTVVATGSALTYQWQEDDGTGFSNVSNGGIYSGATSASLSISNTNIIMDGYEYRCIVDNSTCDSDTSDTAAVTIQVNPSISAQPDDSTICDGGSATFSVTASGTAITYQWQEDDGSGFANISNGGLYSGATTATLSITAASTSLDGYEYRCVVDNSTCSAVNSSSGTFTVNALPAISAHPSDVTECVGNNTSFSITASGTSITYQWQVDLGTGFSDLSNGGFYSGVTTATLSLTSVGTGLDGADYRCVVTGVCTPTQTSNEATLTIQSPPVVTTDPSDVSSCDGDAISYSVVATGTALTYQWQEDDGSGFANISNGGIYSGATTDKLAISAAGAAMHGYEYRCLVDNSSCPQDISDAAKLTILSAPNVTFDPSNSINCEGDNTQFTVTATGASLTYQWQEDNGSGFSNVSNGGIYSGATASTLVLTGLTASNDANLYRCIVSGTCPDDDTSSVASLQVDVAPSVTAQSSDVLECEDADISFEITANGTSLTYQWQEDNGTGFTNISNAGDYSGATSTKLSIADITPSLDGFEYRCIVSGPNCPNDTTDTVSLDVQLKSTVPTASANSTSFCEGNSTTLSAAGGVHGDGAAIEWYTGPNGTGVNFASGAGPITVSHTDTTTYYVRREGTCNTTIDDAITLNVQPKPTAAFGQFETCLGQTTLLFDSSSVADDSISAYYWNLGDGSVSNKKNVNHIYSNTGVYNIVLVVTTANGCKDTADRNTEIYEQPSADFTVNNVCLGKVSEFNNKSSVKGSATLSYEWSFGDGVGTSTDQHPEYDYAATGGYTIQLKATTSEGCADSISKSTNILMLPDADFDFTEACLNDSVSFTNKTKITAGTLTYAWDYGDASPTETGTSPKHKFAAAGKYTVTMVATSNSGCSDTSRQEVETYALPIAGFRFTNACEGELVSFTDTSRNPTMSKLSYDWDFNSRATSSNQNPQISFANSGSKRVSLTVTSAEGCVDSTSSTVSIFGNATIKFTANEVCNAFATSFTNSSTSPDFSSLSYRWSFGDGDTSLRANPFHVYPSAGTYDVTLAVTTGNGCADSSTITAKVWPNPTANYRVSNVCQIDSASFQNLSSVSSGSFNTLWKFGDGSTSTLSNVRHKYASAGTYSSKLIVRTGKGCEDSVGVKVVIYEMPDADFTFNDQCDGDDVVFVNQTNVTTGTQYGWSFGDGSSSTSDNPVHQYPDAATYNVTLTATTANGCKETTPAKQVTIHPRISLGFNAGNVCDNDSVRILNTSFLSAGTATYGLSFGDGDFQLGGAGYHTYDTFGIYTITLYGTTDEGCIDSLKQQVEVYPTPIARYTVASNCQSTFSEFNNSTVITKDVGINYIWDFDNGFSDIQKSPKHQYNAIGTYNTQLIAVTADGCADTTMRTHNVWPVPEPDFKMFGGSTAEVSELCIYETVNFGDASTIATGDIVNWIWDLGDANSKTGLKNIQYNYAVSRVYEVELTVESDSGCTAAITRKLEMLPKPDVEFSMRDTCAGFPVQFVNTSKVDKGQLSFVWDFGDNGKSTLNAPLYTYQSQGTYNVSVIGLSTDGCLDTAGPTPIVIHEIPDPTISSNTGAFAFCEGDTIVMSAASVAGYTYDWGRGFDAKNDTLATTAGTYTVTVTSGFGCSDSQKQEVIVYTRPTANAGTDVTISKGYSTVLNGSGGTFYEWFGDALDDNLKAQPTATPLIDEQYELVVTDDNGCLDTATVMVFVNEDYTLEPSDIFTPNGDGINDVWVIENINTYPDCEVIITNRWQQIIYSSTAYANDWNGKSSDGKELTTGAYNYLIKCGNNKAYTGTVNIIR